MIYLDNNATTQVAPEVVEAMVPYFTEKYWNPSSLYSPAMDTASDLKVARASVASFLGAARPDEILFTSCATESNNTAILGAARATPKGSKRRHLITSKVEHPAILEVIRELERQGYEVTWLDVDRNGNISLSQFVQALRPGETLLVSLMHANNETGVIFPLERLARITKETDPGILFHTDATQSVTKLPIDMSGNFRNIDLLSFSGHKLHAPKGVGALYIRRGTPVRPLLLGGHQEGGRRGGTENLPYIIALAKALEIAKLNHLQEYQEMERLRDRLQKGLLEAISFIEVNGLEAPRMPNTLSVAVHAVEGESLLMLLDDATICASSGSACTSGSLEPSHVLTAMNVPTTAIGGSIRFSLSRYTREEEIDRVISIFPEIAAKVRRLSPFWDQAKETLHVR